MAGSCPELDGVLEPAAALSLLSLAQAACSSKRQMLSLLGHLLPGWKMAP